MNMNVYVGTHNLIYENICSLCRLPFMSNICKNLEDTYVLFKQVVYIISTHMSFIQK